MVREISFRYHISFFGLFPVIGFNTNADAPVIILAATNRPELLDKVTFCPFPYLERKFKEISKKKKRRKAKQRSEKAIFRRKNRSNNLIIVFPFIGITTSWKIRSPDRSGSSRYERARRDSHGKKDLKKN